MSNIRQIGQSFRAWIDHAFLRGLEEVRAVDASMLSEAAAQLWRAQFVRSAWDPAARRPWASRGEAGAKTRPFPHPAGSAPVDVLAHDVFR
jgi:hypothetical protein